MSPRSNLTRPRTSSYALDGCVPAGYHTNPDGDLCLGPKLQLHAIARRAGTLCGYFRDAVVPYLYRHRHTVEYGREPPGWGELKHGAPGLLHYYGHVLGTDDVAVCAELLRLGGLRRRVANKAPCPCGRDRRLGRCHHRRLNGLRRSAGRAALREAQKELLRERGVGDSIRRLA